MKRWLLVMMLAACTRTVAAPDDYVHWLEARSMLAQAATLARNVSGTGKLWAHPYANPRPRAASATASVWFTAYPAATITPLKPSFVRKRPVTTFSDSVAGRVASSAANTTCAVMIIGSVV